MTATESAVGATTMAGESELERASDAAVTAAKDDGKSNVWKDPAPLPACTGYGTNEPVYLKIWLCSGWSLDEMEMGVWLFCKMVFGSGVNDGDPSTKYP